MSDNAATTLQHLIELAENTTDVQYGMHSVLTNIELQIAKIEMAMKLANNSQAIIKNALAGSEDYSLSVSCADNLLKTSMDIRDATIVITELTPVLARILKAKGYDISDDLL